MDWYDQIGVINIVTESAAAAATTTTEKKGLGFSRLRMQTLNLLAWTLIITKKVRGLMGLNLPHHYNWV